MKIEFFNTYISQNANKVVADVLSTSFLSEGKVTERFENELCRQFNLKRLIALNSGTSALHLAMDLLGVGVGDEVIIPAQTFIATGLAVLYCGATPVFADINYSDGNINVASVKAKISPKTKAIICVHWGGNPCDMEELKALIKNTHIKLVEDAAHALGSEYKGQAIGNHSDICCFSFQAIKHLTTGDGGAIVINDEQLYEMALRKKWFGIDRKNAPLSELGERNYDLKELGYKYHLNNYAAALGLANLEGYHTRLKKRQEIADYYTSELKTMKNIRVFEQKPDCLSAYWLFGFHTEQREKLIRKLKDNKIPSSVVHQRIDKYTVFGGIRNDLINQTKFDATQLHIPIHDAIGMKEAEHIVGVIKSGL